MHLAPLLLLATACAASALNVKPQAARTGVRLDPPAKQMSVGRHLPSGVSRQGGDNFTTATEIPAVPFSDFGVTCGFLDDYRQPCPYADSPSPDVVYRYLAPADMTVVVDLCASNFDTKALVYAGDIDHLVACNDDAGCGYSGYQSRLPSVFLEAGVTYYFVVDGYGGACGDYAFVLTQPPPCLVNCPADAVHENEPPLSDDYVDHWNGGCGSTPPHFQWLGGEGSTRLTFCGRTGTFLDHGVEARDTDWFEISAVGGPLLISLTAETSVRMLLLHPPFCGQYLIYGERNTAPCATGTFEFTANADQVFWVWIAPIDFQGVPECDYQMELSGIRPRDNSSIEERAPQVQVSSWGTIKSRYR